jgi:hypothetical protein
MVLFPYFLPLAAVVFPFARIALKLRQGPEAVQERLRVQVKHKISNPPFKLSGLVKISRVTPYKSSMFGSYDFPCMRAPTELRQGPEAVKERLWVQVKHKIGNITLKIKPG